MKKFGIYLSIFLVGLFLASCATVPTGGNGNDILNDVIINTFVGNARESIEFLAYKDGKSGEWQKLTSSNGVYKFEPQAADGNYSIYAVNEWYNESYKKYFYDIQIMNLNTSEGKEVPINFGDWTYSYDSTLTLNFGDDFIDKDYVVFYGFSHGFHWFDEEDDLTYPIEINIDSGTYDLVILAGDPYPEDYSQIYIERNRSISGEESQNISLSDFTTLDTTLDTYTATTTIPGEYPYVELLVGGTTDVFASFDNDKYLRIPSSLKSNDDLYILSVSKRDDDYTRTFTKYKSYPSNIEELNTLPSEDWEMPTFENLTFSWTPYDPDIADHEIRFYETFLSNKDWSMNEDWPITSITWTIILSDGWLGDSSNYEYQLPDLSGLEGWSEDWYPNMDSLSPHIPFQAISGTESNLTKYLDPVAGMEVSVFDYTLILPTYEE
jgi:hypothetical protein